MRYSYRVRFLLVGRILAMAVAAATAFSIVTPPPARAAGVFTMEGGGWGHSVGLSQYGAFGMAQQGFSAEQILTHYFTGVAVEPVAAELAAQPIWVNLTMEDASLTFSVQAIAAGAPPATFSLAGQVYPVAPGGSATITRLQSGGCRLDTPAGSATADCFIDISWDGWAASPMTAIAISGCGLVNWNTPGGAQVQPCTYGRGTIHVRPDNNTNTLNSSVEIAVEDYVLGISEMPYGWSAAGGTEALKAQAIAARSYAFARAQRRGDPADRQWCWCQLYDTTYDQNYVGWGHGTQEWIDVVRSTAGLVLTHPALSPAGPATPIETFYSSSTFGWTENSEDGFTERLEYLRAVDDHWSQLPSVGNPNAAWTRQFTGDQLAALLPGMSTVTGASISRCSTTGAALEITFSGAGGPRTFHTRDLRGRLNLKSQQVVVLTGPSGESRCAGAAGGATTTTTIPATTTTTTVAPATTTTTTPATTTTTTLPVTTTTSIPVTTTGGTACALRTITIDALIASQRVLRAGSVGADVKEMQILLSALAHYDGAADGIFGQRTTAAVRSFQDVRGLVVDGVVGSRTRGEMAALQRAAQRGSVLASDGTLLGRGVTGEVVRALQSVLDLLGFDPGPIDGQFGSLTSSAVAGFQQAANLAVDGIVGVQSRAALTHALSHSTGIDVLTTCP